MSERTNAVTEVRLQALKTLLANTDLDFDRAITSLNPFLDPGGYNRTTQTLAFLAEVVLVNPNFADVMGLWDAKEGFGWILHVCAEALEAQEDIEKALKMIEGNNVTKLEVD